jgi:hypothetical protein
MDHWLIFLKGIMAKNYNILPIALGVDYHLLAEQSGVFVPPLVAGGETPVPEVVPTRAYTGLIFSIEKGDKHYRHIGFSIGDCDYRKLDCGIGIDLLVAIALQVGTFLYSNTIIATALSRDDHTRAIQMINPDLPDSFAGYARLVLQVGTFLYSSTMTANALSRGDYLQVAQLLKAALPDGFTKNVKALNGLTEALKNLQKQQVSLSADEVAIVQSLLQSLAINDDIRVARKLTISVSNPESRFESVSTGIYIDGRPI